jgi:hypothetical protein
MALPQIVPDTDWRRLPITCVEDVQEAVLGAGLDAVQLSPGPMQGSLAFVTSGRMAFSTGHLTGRVSLTGALSETMTTLGVGIRTAPGSRHWMSEVETGGLGIFRAGDTHEAIYLAGTIYACVTLPDTQLKEVAADMGLVLDGAQLGGSRISRRLLSTARFAALQRAFVEVHTVGSRLMCAQPCSTRLCRARAPCRTRRPATAFSA